jgi:MazG family protein
MPPGSSLSRLVDIMDRLLAPDGCPWDREQTLETLRPFLVEETYEVIDALASGDPAHHCEELGDLLFQIVFQSAIRKAEGTFDIDAVIAGISDKLVRRHPHVFAETKGVDTADKVLAQWDEIKAAEKGNPNKRVLDGIPHGPALARAQKVGTRCGKVGFDWPGWEGSFAKVEEEVREVKEAILASDADHIRAEIGDLLFAVVNLARKVGVDAENALVDATAKFTRRFEHSPAVARLHSNRTSRRWMRCGTKRRNPTQESDAFLSSRDRVEEISTTWYLSPRVGPQVIHRNVVYSRNVPK